MSEPIDLDLERVRRMSSNVTADPLTTIRSAGDDAEKDGRPVARMMLLVIHDNEDGSQGYKFYRAGVPWIEEIGLLEIWRDYLLRKR